MTVGSEWNPTEKYQTLVSTIQSILTDEERTVRDIYYALEARGYDYSYDEVNYAIKRGRRAGHIDPSLIVDTSRSADTTPSGVTSDPDQWFRGRIQRSARVYDRDFWEDQDKYVEVWLEKASLSSVFASICREYNVRLEATRGDWSDSKVYRAAQRLIDKLKEGKDVRILYFGDYNPSGYRTPVAIQRVMYCYGLRLIGRDPDSDEVDSYFFNVSPWSSAPTWPEESDMDGSFDMERIALTTDQVERFDLPENPNPSSAASDRDVLKRFKKYVSNGRDVNVELNALKEFKREFLETLIEESIEEHIDEDDKEAHEERVEEDKDDIDDAITTEGDEITIDLDF